MTRMFLSIGSFSLVILFPGRSDTRKIMEIIHIKKDPNAKSDTSQRLELSSVYYSFLRSANKNTASGKTNYRA